jgi:hypothetical protein
VFIAVENLIDDRRRQNVFGLLVSLTMLIEFGDAFDFTAADFRSWCSEAGFQRFAVLSLGGPRPQLTLFAHRTTTVRPSLRPPASHCQ